MKNTTFKNWLANLFGQSESEVELLLSNKTAVKFLIAWSIFEGRCFARFMKAGDIQPFAERLINNEKFDVSSIREHTQHFHERYQDKALYKNLIYDKLSEKKPIRDNLREEIDVILKLPFDKLNAVQAATFSAFVVYRFRNNIFHGNKGVHSWLNFADQIGRCTLIMQLLITHSESIECMLKPSTPDELSTT
jgi:hypothetical protein